MALRFQNGNYAITDVPIQTTSDPRPAPPPAQSHGTTIRRAKTLTRPERQVAPVPLINPQTAHNAAPTPVAPSPNAYNGSEPWRIFTIVVTFWAPGFLLSSIGGIKDKPSQQAWREKMTLCMIIATACAAIGFITVGLQKTLCPEEGQGAASQFIRIGDQGGLLGVQGHMYNVSQASSRDGVDFATLATNGGLDVSYLFERTAADYTECNNVQYSIATDDPCDSKTPCTLDDVRPDANSLSGIGFEDTGALVGYSWEQVSELTNFIVLDGAVLNLNTYFTLHSSATGDNVDKALRTLAAKTTGGKDGTRVFYTQTELTGAVPCLKQRYYAGNIDKITPGCFISQIVLYAGLIIVMSLVLIRFAMACVFNWFLSERLAGPPDSRTLAANAISPAVMPEGANVSIDNKNGTAPWAGAGGGQRKLNKSKGAFDKATNSSSSTLVNTPDNAEPVMSLATIGRELFAVCLVTCYSEGEDSLRTTLDSLSATTYSDKRKLLFIVADGMITGAGEKRSTPDLCVSLLEADPRFGNPTPMLYNAVGSGAKQQNRAMVYAGHYTVAGCRTPTVIVVKCGTEEEAATDKKPGNRGKRDSQLILMNFFSRVTYNDRMSPLDFDLFRKIHVLMGVTPDFFEVCLMVDADTKVFPSSLGHLVNCMHHDPMIMGCCGETRIANKKDSWVTAIQVFEYFISHHSAKAFESVFGGVTCLPGCFSMFRLKARKANGDDWVPLIIKPEIVQEYSQNEVTTLHQKNLLLLGEDRFLTTILLRTFPNRKMMFLPQARCRTVVPDTFSILLSQRRRWINSTIHNLMELVLVRNLCGTFCFSMQFVVFMDLLGTIVLPIAISLTYMLIISIAITPPSTFEQAIPLVLLIAVLGLPAILILLTTRKLVYVAWMMIYLVALPVWNFVLPVYSFWHFDDFSWGETRKVEGEAKGEGHGDGGAKFSGEAIPLRRWEDWERSRLRKIRREDKRRRDFERSHPTGYNGGDEFLAVRSQYGDSDTVSVTSSEDDQWGGQIGGYNENHASYPPPPVGLAPIHDNINEGKTFDENELEAMLDEGFDDRPTPQNQSPVSPYARRYQLSENATSSTALVDSGGYSPVQRATSNHPPEPISPFASAADLRVPQPHNGQYGPLGPLDPSSGSRF